jgi:hypothetical protein
VVTGLLPTWGWRRSTSSDGRRQRSLEGSTDRGFRASFAFSLFVRGLCVKWSAQLSSISFSNVPVFVRVSVWFP